MNKGQEECAWLRQIRIFFGGFLLAWSAIRLAVVFLLFLPLSVPWAGGNQVVDCISEFSGDEEALEGCLSQFFRPDSMDANELLGVHRTILSQLKHYDYDTVHRGAKISAKLCILHLAGDWYSPDVAARLVARIGGEIAGDPASIIADATVEGAMEASEVLGVAPAPMTTSVTSESPALRRRPAAATTTDPVSIYFDNEVVVSTPTDGNPIP